MKKSFLPLVITAGLMGTLLAPQYGFAISESQRIQQEINQLRKAQSAAQQKAAQAEKEIGRLEQDKERLLTEVNTIMGQIDAVNQKLDALNEQVSTVTASLTENAKLLEEAEARITARDQILRSRMRLMYMNGTVSYAEVLLSSTDFGDFLDRLNALKAIVNQDKEILEANKRDRNVIAEKQAVIEKGLAELQNLYAQAAATKADLEVKEKSKQVMIASVSKKQEEFGEISEEAEKQMREAARQEASKQRELDKAQAAEAAKQGKPVTSSYTYSGGKFGYPLPRVVSMSSDFGGRKDPFTGKSAGHTGIDLPSPAGTPILAAEGGKVILASWWSGYGNCVIIDHGNGTWTLYGHIRNGGILVNKGDTVKRGQKIAEVGSTGRSTGNHLHFEVRVNENPVDPKPYLGGK